MVDSNRYPGTPRWVKMFGIFALVLVLLFIVLHLTGRGLGDHRHSGDNAASGDRPTSPVGDH